MIAKLIPQLLSPHPALLEVLKELVELAYEDSADPTPSVSDNSLSLARKSARDFPSILSPIA